MVQSPFHSESKRRSRCLVIVEVPDGIHRRCMPNSEDRATGPLMHASARSLPQQPATRLPSRRGSHAARLDVKAPSRDSPPPDLRPVDWCRICRDLVAALSTEYFSIFSSTICRAATPGQQQQQQQDHYTAPTVFDRTSWTTRITIPNSYSTEKRALH